MGMKAGICVFNGAENIEHLRQPLRNVFNTLCMQSWKSSHGRNCPRHCVQIHNHAIRECRGPQLDRFFLEGVQHQIQMRTPSNERIVQVMAVLKSSQMIHQFHCDSNHTPLACQISRPTCNEDFHLPGATPQNPFGGRNSQGGPHGRGHHPGVGFKGIFREAAQAIASGHAEEYLEDYFENHPDTVKNLSKKAFDSLSKYFNKASTTSLPETTVPAVTTAPPETTIEGDDGETEFTNQWFLNPWFIATNATLVAAICTGLAMGVLCHARLSRTAAREPLLASGNSGPMLREQEMEIHRELEAMGVTSDAGASTVPAAS